MAILCAMCAWQVHAVSGEDAVDERRHVRVTPHVRLHQHVKGLEVYGDGEFVQHGHVNTVVHVLQIVLLARASSRPLEGCLSRPLFAAQVRFVHLIALYSSPSSSMTANWIESSTAIHTTWRRSL